MKYDPMDLNAKGNDVSIETLELANEGVKRIAHQACGQSEVVGHGISHRSPFSLPKGYMCSAGTLHKDGVMRLATAADEILPLADPRVQQNPAYLTVILLSRVITRLGSLADVHPGVIEGLYATDLSYLQALYQSLNGDGAFTAVRVSAVRSPLGRREVRRHGGSMKGYPLKERRGDGLCRVLLPLAVDRGHAAFPHAERRRWCDEISRINRDLNGERKNIFDV